MSTQYDITLESGEKKVFAGAVDWPGWCRAGKDEETAVQALLDAGPRYARVLAGTDLGFEAPQSVSALPIVEHVEGNSGTDFGAPNVPLAGDDQPVDAAELKRLEAVLGACWAAFDTAVAQAEGKELRKGPRGGGRDVPRMVAHVQESAESYLRALGWKAGPGQELREAILEGLAASVAGEIPAEGPRGGKRWLPRTFVRRVAWHVLDHTWELEDRSR
jgi:hypothetical protein